MVRYLNLYSVKLAEIISALHGLTKKSTHDQWESHYQTALDKIMQEFTQPRPFPIMILIQLYFYSVIQATPG